MNVNRVRQLASQYANYDLIQQYTELPPFPDYQIRLMLAFLDQDPGKGQHNELYSLVASLVQIGLDTHELVDVNEQLTDVSQMRSRQLKVLAGDYLSGRYYELLARAGQIEKIQSMSDAICEMNEWKMKLYMCKLQRDLSGEQYLQLLLAIRTRLFLAFEKDIDHSKRSLWKDLLETGTKIEIMLNELQRLKQIDDQYDGWALWEILDSLRKNDWVHDISNLDKPGYIRMWVDDLHLEDRLREKIRQTIRLFKEMLDQDNDPHINAPHIHEAILPFLEYIEQHSSTNNTYVRREASGSESEGKACPRSV